MEAAALLRIGRTTAYELAHEFIRTNGQSGLPVVRIGKQLRVQRTRLNEVVRHGTRGPWDTPVVTASPTSRWQMGQKAVDTARTTNTPHIAGSACVTSRRQERSR